MFASSPPPLSAVTLPNGYQYQSLSPSPSLVHSESDTSLDWSNTDPHLSHRGPSRPTYALQGQPLSAKGQYWTDRSEPYESVQVAQRYQQEQGYGPLTPAYTIIADPESIPITLQEYDGREYGEYEQLRVMDSATMGSAFERPTYTAVGGQSVSMTSEGDSIGVSQQLPTWSWMPLNGSLRAFPGGQEQILGSVSSDMSYLKYPESDLRSSNEQGQMQSIRDTRPTVGERRRSRQNGQTHQSNPIKLERTITETCEDALYIPALSSQSASRSNFAPPPRTTLAPATPQALHLQTQLHSRDNSQLLSARQPNYNPVATAVQNAQAARDNSPMSGHSTANTPSYPYGQTASFATQPTPFSNGTSPHFAPGSGVAQSPSNLSSDYRQDHRRQQSAYSHQLLPTPRCADTARHSVSPQETLLDETNGVDQDLGDDPLFPQHPTTQACVSRPPPLMQMDGMASNGAVGGLFDVPTYQSVNFKVTSPQRPSGDGYDFVPTNADTVAFRPMPFSSIPNQQHGSSTSTSMQPPPPREPSPAFQPPLVSMESTRSDGPDNLGQSSSQESKHYAIDSCAIPLTKPHTSNAETGTYTCTYHGCDQRFDTPRALQKHKREGHRHRQPQSRPTQHTSTRSSTAAANFAPHPLPTPHPPSAAAVAASNNISAPSSVHGSDGTRSISPYEGTQAGPHTCNRVNPQTGKPCNAHFSRPYDLTRHEDTIHNRKKLKIRCEYCIDVEKTFSRRDALTRHLRVVHPEMAENENKRKMKLLGGE